MNLCHLQFFHTILGFRAQNWLLKSGKGAGLRLELKNLRLAFEQRTKSLHS